MSTNDKDLFQTSHLTILISYTIFATILVVESLLLDWEKWALISPWSCWEAPFAEQLFLSNNCVPSVP